MKAHELNVPSDRKPSRVGRGISAGGGKTAGRGTKGQSARSGGKVRPGFEGGQNPLMQRLPKQRGFRSLARNQNLTVYTADLNKLSGKVTNDKLVEAGLIDSANSRVKVILNGEITKKLDVEVQAISKGAQQAIEAKGGTVKIVAKEQRTAAKSKTKTA